MKTIIARSALLLLVFCCQSAAAQPRWQVIYDDQPSDTLSGDTIVHPQHLELIAGPPGKAMWLTRRMGEKVEGKGKRQRTYKIWNYAFHNVQLDSGKIEWICPAKDYFRKRHAQRQGASFDISTGHYYLPTFDIGDCGTPTYSYTWLAVDSTGRLNAPKDSISPEFEDVTYWPEWEPSEEDAPKRVKRNPALAHRVGEKGYMPNLRMFHPALEGCMMGMRRMTSGKVYVYIFDELQTYQFPKQETLILSRNGRRYRFAPRRSKKPLLWTLCLLDTLAILDVEALGDSRLLLSTSGGLVAINTLGKVKDHQLKGTPLRRSFTLNSRKRRVVAQGVDRIHWFDRRLRPVEAYEELWRDHRLIDLARNDERLFTLVERGGAFRLLQWNLNGRLVAEEDLPPHLAQPEQLCVNGPYVAVAGQNRAASAGSPDARPWLAIRRQAGDF